jgi:hypothetical protein
VEWQNLVRRYGYHMAWHFTLSQDETPYALGKTGAADRAAHQLVGDIMIADDGPGDELGEQRDVQGDADRVLLGYGMA